MKNLRFITRLLIGFSIIIFFSSIIVALAFIQIQKISTNVKEIYEHPFIVSNAVKAIEINVNAIDRSMKDVVLSENIEEMNKYVELINQYDSLIHQAFEIVEERYLGNKNNVLDAHITYKDWNKIRSKVIDLKIAGKNNDAIKITKGEGVVHTKLILDKTKVLIEFAKNKADEIYRIHLTEIRKSTIVLLVITFILLMLSIFISIIISKSISNPIQKFIKDIVPIFKSEQTLVNEFQINSEQELLLFTAVELKTAYNNLENVNAELNSTIEEKAKRSAELVIAKFQNEEKAKLVEELLITNQEKKERADELAIVNKELLITNATKDKFFSIIGHDLKSPFNSIVGFSNLLVELVREKDYDSIEKYAGIIEQSSNRAMDLLMNLIEWSRSQTGRIEFNPEYFEMISLINETALLFDDIAGQKTITIARNLPANAPIFADKAMINTVLRNLISNAIKFTQPEGKITISAMDKQNELTISVSDNGIGISKERIDKLFNISNGYSTPGTQNEMGTGLGLILCKEFINKNNGKIWVESKAGIGTTFYFSLPLLIKNRQKIDILKQ